MSTVTITSVSVEQLNATINLENDVDYVVMFLDVEIYRTDISFADAYERAKSHLEQVSGNAALVDERFSESQRRERAAAFFRAAVADMPGRDGNLDFD